MLKVAVFLRLGGEGDRIGAATERVAGPDEVEAIRRKGVFAERAATRRSAAEDIRAEKQLLPETM